MKALFEKIDTWPSDWHGSVTFAPPTYSEQLWAAVMTLLMLVCLFSIIALVARFAMWLWDRREARRPLRYGVRRVR